ncbi:DMT family transporter [Sphingobium yanoikuyae]|uniref:Multidrug transporter n=1 Tax=Sphingobium yanoikuyae TaxID=13690 RepID=A0A291N041_SPHYA|nr:DMT family transporter [Sphingobium yanoikuyae]ATI80709.1 multidrug transporter [Sphingobium yanoikuyae]
MIKAQNHDNARGGMWILASGLAYSLGMALVKLLGDDYSAPTQNFVRQSIGLIVLVPFILHNPRSAFTIRRPKLMMARCAATSLSIILAYNSFHLLGLAEANALSFTRALFLVPLAAVMLAERVDRHKLLATLVGFGGVLIILAPGSARSLIGWPAAQGLLSALLLSWSVVTVKTMVRDHSDLALLSWSALMGVVFTAPFAWASWRMPQIGDAALMGVMGILGVISQACYIRGMALGEASLMAPLDYVRILFTTALGYVMFAQLPLPGTYAGSALIILAAIYVTLHGRRRDAALMMAAQHSRGISVLPAGSREVPDER